MKFLKKLLFATLSLILVFSSCFFLTGCGNREEVLRLYVPGEYIPDETLSGFEDWYLETTGKKITVQKKEFDTNETMYTMVAVKRQDFDVICPSDYMVERLKNEGLLLKVKPSIMEEIKASVLGDDEGTGIYPNQDLVNLIQDSFDPNFEYTAPYMWGTMGLMYYYGGDQNNTEAVKAADAEKSTWKNLFDVTKRNIYMKDSERDCYTVALFYHYYDELKQTSNNFTDFENDDYQALITDIFTKGNNFNAKLDAAEDILKNQKQYVYDYETDEGKDDLLTSKGAQGYYGMFWSCDAGYIMADWSGDEVVYNENFRYIVPTEGSNVWVDSFCIPKYAGNKSAAEMFMLYMSDPEVAFDCMDYAGCTSANYQTTVDYYDYLTDPNENDIFLNTTQAFQAMYLSLMFPHLDITLGEYTFSSPLKKCGVMRDLGSKASDELLIMWSILRRY